uniref:Hydrolase n=1 Tax=Podoviridae sp. ctIi724 TaxID=2827731 RepID=A0A8S5SRX9_9CAUD|nr:MAG TPA: hydrolase [Podoviridae sp. ctIi724]
MPDINITVAHKVAVSDTSTIVCDNSDYTVHWTLDEEWSAYDTKTMRTIYMDGTYEDKVFSGSDIALPVCTVPGAVQIGLFAGNIRTSRVAILRALPSVRSAAGAPADPAPDVYDQLMELINGMGGADPDVIAKAVADYLAAHPIEETDPTVPEWAKAEITGATVGQIAKIAAVDESGAPTAWSPVDMPSGGSNVTITDDDVTAERAYAAAATPKVIGTNSVTPSGNTLKFIAAQDGTLSVGNALLLSYNYVNIALDNANGQPLYSVEPIESGFAISLNPNYTLGTHFANGRFAFPATISAGKTYTLRWYGRNSYIYLVKTVDGSMTAGQKLVSSSTSNGAHVAQFEADARYAGIRFAVDLSEGSPANITKITLAEGNTAAEYTPSAEVKQVNVTAGKSYYLSGVKNKSVSGLGTFYSAPDAVLTVNGVSPTGGDVKTYATTKTFVCLGDSIWTFGAGTGGIGTISDYAKLLCGGTWHNIATGGSTMANRPGNYAGDYDAFDFHALADCVASGDFSAPKAAASGLTTNIANVDAVTWADVDVITIAYGTNDLAFGGTLDNDNNLYDKATVCGALRYGIKTIAAAYPNIKFMVLGILYRNADSVDVKTISEWNDGLRKTAEMMGAEYVPMIGINVGNSGTYLYDGTHPNAVGKEAIAKCVAKHIINI